MVCKTDFKKLLCRSSKTKIAYRKWENRNQYSELCQNFFTIKKIVKKQGPLRATFYSSWKHTYAQKGERIINTIRGRFHQHMREAFLPDFFAEFLSDFFACKIWLFLWRMAFGEQRTNLANFHLRNWHKYYWWNWTANFLPNVVRQRLFAWRTKFGEIGPWGGEGRYFATKHGPWSWVYFPIS